MNMDLSVIIPTHNRNDDLALLLNSIMRQNLGGLKVEFIIAGNLHDPKLQDYIEKLGTHQFSYHSSGKIGVNIARNLGLKVSQSQNIYFLDDDVKLKNPGHLKLVYDLALSHPEIAAFGGSYLLASNASIIDKTYHAICTSWLNDDQTVHLLGGNTFYNKKILRDQLIFNEDIIFGGSETEMNLRLHTAGFKFLFFKSIDVDHHTHLSLFGLIKKSIRQGMGRYRHEGLVSKDFWKSSKTNPEMFLEESSQSKLAFMISVAYLSLYNFFFHVGYRHGIRQKNGPLSKMAVTICSFQTFFQINSDQVLFLNDTQAEPFHSKKFPALKFREIHHWLKGNFWWKISKFFFQTIPTLLFRIIPELLYHIIIIILFVRILNPLLRRIFFWFWRISHYLIWKVIPPIGMIVVCAIITFFPFNTIGLRVPYNNLSDNFDNFFKKREKE